MTRSSKPRKPRRPETVLRELSWYLRTHTGAGSRGHALVLELRQALKQTKERR